MFIHKNTDLFKEFFPMNKLSWFMEFKPFNLLSIYKNTIKGFLYFVV